MWLGSGESFEAARDLRVGILAAPGQVHSPEPWFPTDPVRNCCSPGRAAYKVASCGESEGLRFWDPCLPSFCRQLCSQQPVPSEWVL